AALFGRLKITWRIQFGSASNGFARRRAEGAPGHFQESFDADKVGSTIALRHWQPGDRFQPIGMQTSVKLQDLFSNQKIPREQRHHLAVGVAVGGELFWVEGLRISERFKLDKNTVRRLNWYWQCK